MNYELIHQCSYTGSYSTYYHTIYLFPELGVTVEIEKYNDDKTLKYSGLKHNIDIVKQFVKEKNETL